MIKSVPDPNVIQWFQARKPHEPFISAMTWGTYIHVFTNPVLSTKMYAYIHRYPVRDGMTNTKLFKNGNSQAVRIPAELAYSSWDIELVIERQDDELRIRPARRRMGDVLGKLAQFSPDFMSEGRGINVEGGREAL